MVLQFGFFLRYFYVNQFLSFDGGNHIAIHEAEAVEIKTIRLQFCDKEVMRQTVISLR